MPINSVDSNVAATGRGNVTETFALIASDKVEGTAVYDMEGRHIGKIERVMLDKRSGQVAYAVLTFGGFLGMGKDYYPLPWASLTYNEDLGGYEIDISEEQIKGAPKYAEDTWDWASQDAARRLHDYYGVPPTWY